MNFNNKEETTILYNKLYTDLISQQEVDGKNRTGTFDIRILKKQKITNIYIKTIQIVCNGTNMQIICSTIYCYF